jgi:hypothetical protein
MVTISAAHFIGFFESFKFTHHLCWTAAFENTEKLEISDIGVM